MKPSSAAVLALLRERGPRGVTSLDALEHVHTMRLAARVADLRADGFDVRTEWVTAGGARFARYVLEEPAQMVAGL